MEILDGFETERTWLWLEVEGGGYHDWEPVQTFSVTVCRGEALDRAGTPRTWRTEVSTPFLGTARRTFERLRREALERGEIPAEDREKERRR